MNRLTKNERLRSRKTIEQLLTHGKSFFVFPFRVISSFEFRVSGNKMFQQPNVIARSVSDEATSLLTDTLNSNFNSQFSILNSQLLIAVPKRRIKKAITRNLIKRRTREAWRLHKSQLRITNLEGLDEVNYELRDTDVKLDVGYQASGIRYQDNTSHPAPRTQHLVAFPVILQYVADEPLAYAVIEEAVKTIIRRLEQEIKKLGD